MELASLKRRGAPRSAAPSAESQRDCYSRDSLVRAEVHCRSMRWAGRWLAYGW